MLETMEVKGRFNDDEVSQDGGLMICLYRINPCQVSIAR